MMPCLQAKPVPGTLPPSLLLTLPPSPAGRDVSELAKTARVVLGHEKEVALALQIARFSGGWLVVHALKNAGDACVCAGDVLGAPRAHQHLRALHLASLKLPARPCPPPSSLPHPPPAHSPALRPAPCRRGG